MAQSNMEKKSITILRYFNAPLELVWQAWSVAEHMEQWWGPKNFTSPKCNTDFRVGGKYHWCMRSPEGQDFWTTGIYREIEPMQKIVYTDNFADPEGNIVPATYYGMGEELSGECLVTLTFEEADGKTQMTVVHEGLPDGEILDLTTQSWNDSFDKLQGSL
jgi:uncharacterized protein YndB with AHSA1/START domain